jgi:hypothetical protein
VQKYQAAVNDPALDLASLLTAHGLTGVPEAALEHTGFSGALITSLRRADGARFVLKRLSIDRDWIMRATDDLACREAQFAACQPSLGQRIATPSIGVTGDGDGFAVLMDDITEYLLPQGSITEAQLDLIIDGVAALHALPLPEAAPVPWCDVRQRLLLLTPHRARMAAEYEAPVARDLARGWEIFDRLAPPPVVELIRGLSKDPTPLIDALAPLPASLLHGDLKLDNIGLDPSGRLWLIDWAMPMLAPPAVELGWFLAINSRRLPRTLDETMRRYATATGMPPAHRERHDAAAVLCGLLLRGWRKAIDADEGEPDELHWWCECAEAAQRFL